MWLSFVDSNRCLPPSFPLSLRVCARGSASPPLLHVQRCLSFFLPAPHALTLLAVMPAPVHAGPLPLGAAPPSTTATVPWSAITGLSPARVHLVRSTTLLSSRSPKPARGFTSPHSFAPDVAASTTATTCASEPGPSGAMGPPCQCGYFLHLLPCARTRLGPHCPVAAPLSAQPAVRRSSPASRTTT